MLDVLQYLKKHKSITISEALDAFDAPPMDVIKVIKEMERKGYFKKDAAPSESAGMKKAFRLVLSWLRGYEGIPSSTIQLPEGKKVKCKDGVFATDNDVLIASIIARLEKEVEA